MPGGVTVEWSPTSTHGNHNHQDGLEGGNIHLRSDAPDVCDIVLHEYGHEVQWDGYGGWLPETGCPDPHYAQKASTANCAWVEGFANWYKMVVSNDPVRHWPGGAELDLEAPTWGTSGWDNGDTCEGRISGSLWDLGDSNVDGIDTSALGWYSIWVTWYNHRDSTFRDFWNRWKNNSLPTHNTLKAFFQNTVDYDTAPTFSTMPDIWLREDESLDNVIDLHQYVYDPESLDTELEFSVEAYSSYGITVDSNRYIDVNPEPNWYGVSFADVYCSDGVKSPKALLRVYVTMVNDPPQWSTAPKVILTEDQSADNAVDLWSFSSDLESEDSELTYSIVGKPGDYKTGPALDSNRYIDIVPAANWNGTCTATIRAHDGASYTDTELFITVNAVNDIPVWSTLPDKTLNEDTIMDNAIDLHAYVQDVETPDPGLVFSVTGNTNPSCGVSIDGNRYLDIRPTANWFGTSTLTIRCTDGILQASDVIVITVNPVNDTPTIDSLADVLVAKGSSNNDAVHISEYGWDIDDNLGTLTFSIVSMTNANCGAVMDSNEFIDINPTSTWTGYSDVKVRVTDPAGLYVEDTFRIVAAQFVDRLSEARSSNMAWVAVRDKTVTAKFTDFMYVEEQDRSPGLKLYHYQSVTPGQKVTAAGPVYTVNSERHLTVYYFTINGSTQQIRPLAMPNGALGGEAPNAYTPSVPPGAAGLYNVGMLVSTSGQVMYLAPGGQFYISDGSSVIDSRISTGEPWLLVDRISTGWQPALGSYVTVTGISSVSTVGGSPVRMLRPRNQQDIRVW